jgi:hypothetical protein
MFLMDFPNAVTNPANFYNRQSEFERAMQVLLYRKRVPVLVVGERRIGKTSLQNVVIEGIKTECSQAKILGIEPRGCHSVDSFFEAILQRVGALLNQKAVAYRQPNLQGKIHLETPDQFDRMLQSMLPADFDGKILLCVDEFDEIVRQAGKNGKTEQDRLFGLIHHLVERTTLPLSLFLTVTRLPELMTTDFPSSLVANAEIIELLPLEKRVASGMIEWLLQDRHISLDVDAQEVLNDMAGGHPYFIKLLVSNLVEEDQCAEEKVVTVDEVWNRVIPRALEDARAAYAISNLYRAHFTPSEKKVLLYIVERGEPVEGSELRKAGSEASYALRSLFKRNYLIEQGDKYLIRIRFLDYWLRHWIEFDEELERLGVHDFVPADTSSDIVDEDGNVV